MICPEMSLHIPHIGYIPCAKEECAKWSRKYECCGMIHPEMTGDTAISSRKPSKEIPCGSTCAY